MIITLRNIFIFKCIHLQQVDICDGYDSSIQVQWNEGMVHITIIFKVYIHAVMNQSLSLQKCHPFCVPLMSMATQYQLAFLILMVTRLCKI